MNHITSRAPGRINIIGEHTDYNQGFVLPAAIDRYMEFELSANPTLNQCHVEALDLQEKHSFNLNSLRRVPSGWANYVMGVASELQKLDVPLRGFTARFRGSIPIGGGVSSSAALENSLALGLLKLYPKSLTDWEIIQACQMAEHHFAGIKCGIMDQFSSMLGRKDHVVLLDCRSREFQYHPWDFPNHQILLLNTNVSHELASSEYNARREECQAGVTTLQRFYPSIQSLRDVTLDQLIVHQSSLPVRVFQRCRHVISENARVVATTQALEQNDIGAVGQLMFESHRSLSDDYAVSCSELDFLVSEAKNTEGIIGSRMMGGGFGGCTINLVEREKAANITEMLTKKYRDTFGIDCAPLLINISDGAKYLV